MNKFNKKSGKKPNNKCKSSKDVYVPKEDKGTKYDFSKGALNDMSWYDHHPELTESVARLAYPYKPGMKTHPLTNLYELSGGTASTKLDAWYIPGVMALNFLPSVGHSEDSNSPASIAAREIYSKVRSKFSGTLAADPVDFMIYTMAIDSVYSYIGYLKRVYRTINAFTPQNFNLPNVALRAMGFTEAQINQLRVDRVKLWGVINTLSLDANKYNLPGVMDIFKRHYWLNTNIYLDAPVEAAQMYIFNQLGYYKFGLDTNQAGMLNMVPINWKDVQPADLVNEMFKFGNSLLAALNDSEDAYTINGYITRAYEGESYFTSDIISQDDIIKPVYVPEVLMQIENSKSALPYEYISAWKSNFQTGTKTDCTAWAIKQDPTSNTILHTPMVEKQSSKNAILQPDDYFINMRKDNPTVADNIIATRFTTRLMKQDDKYTIACGSEALMYYTVYLLGGSKDTSGNQVIGWTDMTNFVSSKFATSSSTALEVTFNLTDLATLSNLSYFNQHPLIFLHASYSVGSTVNNVTQPLFDVDNMTNIAMSQLDEMDRVCLYSLMNAF